jgi:hypothetical protein
VGRSNVETVETTKPKEKTRRQQSERPLAIQAVSPLGESSDTLPISVWHVRPPFIDFAAVLRTRFDRVFQ